MRVKARLRRSFGVTLVLGGLASLALCGMASDVTASDLVVTAANVWVPAAAYGFSLLTAWGSMKK
jgi:hypothetical protein